VIRGTARASTEGRAIETTSLLAVPLGERIGFLIIWVPRHLFVKRDSRVQVDTVLLQVGSDQVEPSRMKPCSIVKMPSAVVLHCAQKDSRRALRFYTSRAGNIKKSH